MYSYGSPHTAAQKQDDQHERTFSSYVRIQVVVLKTYLGRWTIGRSGERGSGISVLPARYDDDDIYEVYTISKYKDLREQCVRNGWMTHVFSIEVGCRGFITNSTSAFLTNLGISPSDKRKYIKKIQDKALTASAWTQSHHLMRALLEAMLVYKHQSLYEPIYIYIYIYIYIRGAYDKFPDFFRMGTFIHSTHVKLYSPSK